MDAFDCGNSFCVLNDAQVTDNDRTYFYSLSEAFSGFEFDQTTYQLSNQAESGWPTFEFDVDINNQVQRITLGNDGQGGISSEDYDTLSSAFANADQQALQLRRGDQERGKKYD